VSCGRASKLADAIQRAAATSPAPSTLNEARWEL
jgi:hypothetical protein